MAAGRGVFLYGTELSDETDDPSTTCPRHYEQWRPRGQLPQQPHLTPSWQAIVDVSLYRMSKELLKSDEVDELKSRWKDKTRQDKDVQGKMGSTQDKTRQGK